MLNRVIVMKYKKEGNKLAHELAKRNNGEIYSFTNSLKKIKKNLYQLPIH